MKKRVFAFCLAAVMSLSMVACGSNGGNTTSNSGSETSESASDGEATEVAGAGESYFWANTDEANTTTTDETIVIQLSSEPAGLWAAGTGRSENECNIVDAAMFDTLVSVDRSTGEVIPNLATSWEWVDDTHCKYTLRDDVKMTDGTPLVADDVVYSVDIWKTQSANSDTGRFVSGAVAEDNQTVVIEYNTEAPDLINLMTWAQFGIVSEDEVNALGGIEAADAKPLMGSGKYRFKEWKNGQYIELERNEDYWNPDYKGYFKTIRLTFIQDAASRAMSVLSGDAQVAYNMPLNMAATYMGNDQIKLVVNSFGQNTRLWYNMGPNAGATKDIKVRQAIDKALDFNAIAQVGTGGFGKEVHGYFPADSKYYNETFTADERVVDIDGAKALLEEAGYADGLELTIVGMQDQEPVFVVMQDCLSKVGIKLNISILDTPAFVGAANGGDYDLIQVGDLVDARYPAAFTFIRQQMIDTFCIGGSKWTNPEIEEKVNALIEEPDEAKAKTIAGEMEQLLKDNMLFSNTYEEIYANLTAPDLKGYKTLERGFIDITSLYK